MKTGLFLIFNLILIDIFVHSTRIIGLNRFILNNDASNFKIPLSRFNSNQNSFKSKLKKRGIAYYLANGISNKISTSNKKPVKFSCTDKEDEGHYEHTDCKKYWHCLYVGTIFENALERKCPIGTMFHPIERVCEISTMVSLKN